MTNLQGVGGGVGGGVNSTLSCVKLSSMLFNHAYEICLIFGPI